MAKAREQGTEKDDGIRSYWPEGTLKTSTMALGHRDGLDNSRHRRRRRLWRRVKS